MSDPSPDRAKLEYIEEMGLLMERFGLPRMPGRVLGALLLADPPEQTAEALASTLRASRGSISASTRALMQLGLIERVGKPGERRDFFRNRPNAWAELTKLQMLNIKLFKEMAQKGLTIVKSDDPDVRLGLVEMLEFYEFWEGELPKVFRDWETARAERQAASETTKGSS